VPPKIGAGYPVATRSKARGQEAIGAPEIPHPGYEEHERTGAGNVVTDLSFGAVYELGVGVGDHGLSFHVVG
jgi:hypothetical protein